MKEVKNTGGELLGMEECEYADALDGPAGGRYHQNMSRHIGL